MKIDVYPTPKWKPHCFNTWRVWRGSERLGDFRNLEECVVGYLRKTYPCDSIIVHRGPKKRKQ